MTTLKTALRAALAIVLFLPIGLSAAISSGADVPGFRSASLTDLSEPVMLAALGIGMLLVAQTARKNPASVSE